MDTRSSRSSKSDASPFEKLRADIAKQVGQRKWAQRRRVVIDSLKEVRDLRYHRDRIHAVLAALQGRALDQPQAPLIEYEEGRIGVGDVVGRLRSLKKGALPPDSAAAFFGY